MAAYRYNYAIVSRIADTFKDNCSTKKGTIDLEKARFEHENLVESLRKIGLDVLELPSDDRHPDGLFVDDTAVVINGIALVCSLHKAERKGEVRVVSVSFIGLHVALSVMLTGTGRERSDPSSEDAELC